MEAKQMFPLTTVRGRGLRTRPVIEHIGSYGSYLKSSIDTVCFV
jgi:hypothetical protein